MSPEVGVLDQDALERALAEDPSAALVLVADLMTATDERLRAAARRLAARLVLDRSRIGQPTRRGTGRPRRVPADTGGDLDLDGSFEAIVTATAEGRPPALDELVARDWARPDLSLCLLVDDSGSMTGERLAAAAMTAAACTWRAPVEHAVLAFARDVRALQEMHGHTSASTVVDRVLCLRGYGLTALAGALRAATDQLGRARATRRVTVLLSDCRATDQEDPRPAAAAVQELVILAPDGDADAARDLAAASGARWAALTGADSAPALLLDLLG